ncbi:hypothetical protein HU200_053398 [Digitaria exilis]|uniref:Uncharacterized protein n=1 Tax=Digitaria exilis TaxID=1010633 RepID=A0A835E8J2_9POAL|nr:hypothetical protein HU200_053398 [Digitaria exilis]
MHRARSLQSQATRAMVAKLLAKLDDLLLWCLVDWRRKKKNFFLGNVFCGRDE